MKSLNIFNHFLFRVPIYSLDVLGEKRTKDQYENLCDSLWKEAIFLASPSLFKELGQQSEKKDTVRLAISILKYYWICNRKLNG